MKYSDSTIIQFGQFKNKALEDIPDSWFKSFWWMNQAWYKSRKTDNGSNPFIQNSKGYDFQRFATMEYIEDNFEESDL